MSVFDEAESFLRRQYLFVRQQVRHLQAGLSYWSGRPLPDTRFVLFGRGRSGTTALVSMLDDVPGLQCEGEVLHDYVPFPYRHVLGRAARCSAPAYGCKILGYQIRDVQRLPVPNDNFLRVLHREHDFQVLYLRRTNLLWHALSNIQARQDTFHRKMSAPDAEPPALHADPDHVIEWMEKTEALREYEATLLEDVPHLSLTYEKHIRHAEDHQSTVDAICDFLNIESAPVESSYRKTAPSALRERVTNYEVLTRRLRDTPYADYLE